ncbi:hypothetical protein ALC53_08289 [Atta colombica]|uniref:Uncharacterized protein n=1 Tax=Atta colombica TaxID=520822 RepID=A0A195B9L3_9HYME|nr:hypothetical protein ALC53_08289 [Atta colombica]
MLTEMESTLVETGASRFVVLVLLLINIPCRLSATDMYLDVRSRNLPAGIGAVPSAGGTPSAAGTGTAGTPPSAGGAAAGTGSAGGGTGAGGVGAGSGVGVGSGGGGGSTGASACSPSYMENAYLLKVN